MTKKTTRKALLLSALSLLVCCSMLVGTTFAWFTDSVTSANNVIKSGNLKIDLEYWNGAAWVDVDGASDVLDGDEWEPGYTDVAYLRLKNAGSLALKYQLGVNVVSETAGVNAAGEGFKLSDYIYFDVEKDVNGETNAYADRDAAMAIATQTAKISVGYTQADELAAGSDCVYLAMVVYMPESVGNEANHNGTDVPRIDLGLSVVATQLEYESDSFGTDYDEDATYVSVATFDELKAALAEGGNVILTSDIDAHEILLVEKATLIDGNGKTITSSATRGINVRSTEEVTIKNLEIVTSTNCERAINIIEAAGTTNIENVKISGDGVLKFAVNMANNVPAGAVVNIKNSELSAWKAIQEYASDSTLNVENSKLNGWAGIAIYGNDTVINIEDSTLVGSNTYPAAQTQNTYSTIAVGRNTSNVELNVTGGSVTAQSEAGYATQWVYGYNENCSINAKLDTELILVGDNAKYFNADLTASSLIIRDAYASAANAEGYTTVDNGDGTCTVS